jgi:PIN domain nuclease of toxin-antitoxin system
VNFLLDTHIILGILNETTENFPKFIQNVLKNQSSTFHVSTASLWEIAIKTRMGKLELGINLDELPGILERIGHTILNIEPKDVLIDLTPTPTTKDPFDRLLLAQCETKKLRLVTQDRALVTHPLALAPASH